MTVRLDQDADESAERLEAAHARHVAACEEWRMWRQELRDRTADESVSHAWMALGLAALNTDGAAQHLDRVEIEVGRFQEATR